MISKPIPATLLNALLIMMTCSEMVNSYVNYCRSEIVNNHVIIAASTLFCIGFIGNSITVCFVAVSKQLHTPTYVDIGYLTVTDNCTRFSEAIWYYFA